MTRHNIVFITVCSLSLLLCSCKKQGGERSIEEIVAQTVILQPDTTLYGMLSRITADSLFITLEGTTETRSYAYTDAAGSMKIYGSLTEGEKYAMQISPNEKMARHIVNLTELSGQWFYDMKDYRGFDITLSGAFSPINPKDVCFKKWKFLNGKIVLYYVNIDQAADHERDYMTDTTEIMNLTKDELDFTFRGENFHCQRHREAIKMQF